jgi:hypothetical protein
MTTTIVNEKEINGWEVTIYNPKQGDIIEEERDILLKKKYKTLTVALKEIQSTVEPYGMSVSLISLRKISTNDYGSDKSKLFKSIKIRKCKLRVKNTKELIDENQ